MPLNTLTGSAASDLGLGYGGDALAGESEEARRKRMLEASQRRMMGPGMSLAAPMLFGTGGAGGASGGAGGTGY